MSVNFTAGCTLDNQLAWCVLYVGYPVVAMCMAAGTRRDTPGQVNSYRTCAHINYDDVFKYPIWPFYSKYLLVWP